MKAAIPNFASREALGYAALAIALLVVLRYGPSSIAKGVGDLVTGTVSGLWGVAGEIDKNINAGIGAAAGEVGGKIRAKIVNADYSNPISRGTDTVLKSVGVIDEEDSLGTAIYGWIHGDNF